ncbi:DinB family protein [Mycetocola tolaasinivorans]|uniref:DinB family protein n=1 Tax=Mycetocola tolaasinivorans TaxID=76635 RepID=A0A3L6ZXV2_9MICO|nr:DinB family protein [Mycetocola tolaasinivorans]RLP72749.1 DinB family protein [Mycetocola tolaasinivorans]
MQREDPHPTGDEREILVSLLDFHRATILDKTAGLSAAQLGTASTVSTLTLGGLLRHLTFVEDIWFIRRFRGLRVPEPWASAPWSDDPDWELTSAAGFTAERLRGDYLAAIERSRDLLCSADLSALAEVPDQHGTHWNLRGIIAHLIEETARHNGHADIIREALDGVVGE